MNCEKIIWYPGSAYASQEWINYLRKTFEGKWIFSDNCENRQWVLPEQNNSYTFIVHNTLDPTIPRELNNNLPDILIISRHPGLKDFKEIKDSDILVRCKPNKLIYDPNNVDIIERLKEQLSEKEDFLSAGYRLDKIVVLPDLNRQYSEFSKI